MGVTHTPTSTAKRLRSIARNHPFLDGNKRAAALAMLMFYRLNGWQVLADQGDLVALVTDTADGLIDVELIAGVLKGWAVPLDLGDVDEY